MAHFKFVKTIETDLEWHDIEERLYAIAEWMGFSLLYEDPDYILTRADHKRLLPSARELPTQLVVKLNRLGTGRTAIELSLEVREEPGSVVDLAEQEVLRGELDDIVAWIESLDGPTLDRAAQYEVMHQRDIRVAIKLEILIWLAGLLVWWRLGWVKALSLVLFAYLLLYVVHRRYRGRIPAIPLVREGPHMGLAQRLREHYQGMRLEEIRNLQDPI